MEYSGRRYKYKTYTMVRMILRFNIKIMNRSQYMNYLDSFTLACFLFFFSNKFLVHKDLLIVLLKDFEHPSDFSILMPRLSYSPPFPWILPTVSQSWCIANSIRNKPPRCHFPVYGFSVKGSKLDL